MSAAYEVRAALDRIAALEQVVAGLRDRLAAAEAQRDEARSAERARVVAWLRANACCGAPSICGARCQDDEISDVLARSGGVIADYLERHGALVLRPYTRDEP